MTERERQEMERAIDDLIHGRLDTTTGSNPLSDMPPDAISRSCGEISFSVGELNVMAIGLMFFGAAVRGMSPSAAIEMMIKAMVTGAVAPEDEASLSNKVRIMMDEVRKLIDDQQQ